MMWLRDPTPVPLDCTSRLSHPAGVSPIVQQPQRRHVKNQHTAFVTASDSQATTTTSTAASGMRTAVCICPVLPKRQAIWTTATNAETSEARSDKRIHARDKQSG